MKTPRLPCSLATALLLALTPPLYAAPYTIVDLGGGNFPTTASGINDRGQVVGFFNTSLLVPNRVVGFLYEAKNGAVTILPTLGGLDTFPRAIDQRGEHIVGASTRLGDPTLHAMYFHTASGVMTDLGASGPAPALASEVFAIHSTPIFGLTLIGKSFPLPGAAQTEATRWTGPSVIRQGQGGITRAAYSVNAAGVFVGEKDFGGGVVRAFATFPGSGILDLPTFGGSSTVPAAINDSNQIVGAGNLPGDDNFHAFLVKAGDAALVDLGTIGPPLNRNSRANAINQHGQIVGWSEIDDDDDERHAFLYKDGTMIDLNSLLPPGSGWVLKEATGINRYGQIVGTGMLGGFPHAFLLNPPLSFQVAGKKDLRVPENLKRLTFTGEGSLTLSSVTYRVGNRGKLQTAKGTLRWRFNARLKPGPNIVTIFANSPGVVSKPTKIRVRRL
jgi:probable HAF family extracellular repeat protein